VTPSLDSFKSRRTLTVEGVDYDYFSIPEAEKNGLAGVVNAARLAEGAAREPPPP
jgi:acylphosphatase